MREQKIVDEAWRTIGVRQLIATPLYLSALLGSSSTGVRPTTKEELLRMFVEQHEQTSEHAETLNGTLFGCHVSVLRALARQLNTASSTAMSESEARRVVSRELNELRQQGQINGLIEPSVALDVLANHHALMRSGSGSGTISFQHQQFQEWFASYDVEDLMRRSAGGESDAQVMLRETVLDRPSWEESILFAVERVSRVHDGLAVIAHAVRLALAIDPILAAEMIYRSVDGVWEMVCAEVMPFVDRWHEPGQVDRAARFMIISGRPEFASRVWPLVSSTDSQIQLPALRTAPRFRPSVLGPDLATKVAALPEGTREHLLALIASESDVDGMELATELAKADSSPKVQAEVVQYLLFRRAERHASSLLASAHDQTWALVASHLHDDEISSPVMLERFTRERAKLVATATTPTQRLHYLLDDASSDPDRDLKIAAVVSDPEFPVKGDNNNRILHFAQDKAPAALLRGLEQRVEAGLELPFVTTGFFEQFDPVDEDPISAIVLDTSQDKRAHDGFAVLAGPETTGALIEKFSECGAAVRADGGNRQLSDEYYRIKTRVGTTRRSAFVDAFIARAETDDLKMIHDLCDLAAAHGNTSDQNRGMQLDPGARATFDRHSAALGGCCHQVTGLEPWRLVRGIKCHRALRPPRTCARANTAAG